MTSMFYRNAVRSPQSFRAWNPETFIVNTLWGPLGLSLTIGSTVWVGEGTILPIYWGSEYSVTPGWRNSTKWLHTQQRRFNSVGDYILTVSTCYWSACSSAFRWKSTRLRTKFKRNCAAEPITSRLCFHLTLNTEVAVKGAHHCGTHKRDLQR